MLGWLKLSRHGVMVGEKDVAGVGKEKVEGAASWIGGGLMDWWRCIVVVVHCCGAGEREGASIRSAPSDLHPQICIYTQRLLAGQHSCSDFCSPDYVL